MNEPLTPAEPRRISVIIPCLNDAELLERCLHSFQTQLLPADEIIVVDNGSTDNSAAIAHQAGARVVTEPRRGITWATQTGFDAATGDILLRVDADTRAEEDFILRLHHAWEAAEKSPGRTVVGVTGSARFEIPGALGTIATSLYLGAYRTSVGSALGHHPFFGTNYSIRAQWWHQIRDAVDFSDTYVHEDMHLSFAVRENETVWYQPDLLLSMDDRALHGFRQVLVRFHRGFYTMLRNWRTHPPHLRLAQRGVLGPRLKEVLKP
ncbi:Poly-beta-1,6-N-acetyl-D-glucosamine synthase [Corynebacterium occultum]|uniref:4,4'-diaponeurosporenoate glycosyltransferase n=1 Tax=Corynebacterium occultum TaxID=2675219 RepID=A0A6B8W4G2_9CORY|nr:glycosyltransferase [Corynebacterium occultum]QGU07411.1 Poly-beta-1,6-N-acetyl-D-glucosamine synthase [Corynebacterium occultum]